MNLLEKRKDNARLVLEGRFIKKVLTEQSEAMLEAQTKEMNAKGFKTQAFFSNRSFTASDDVSRLKFLTVHRFVDIKTRKTKRGVIKKKSHPIYNRIMWGHLPNIVRQLAYGFTDTVIDEMKKLED